MLKRRSRVVSKRPLATSTETLAVRRTRGPSAIGGTRSPGLGAGCTAVLLAFEALPPAAAPPLVVPAEPAAPPVVDEARFPQAATATTARATTGSCRSREK